MLCVSQAHAHLVLLCKGGSEQHGDALAEQHRLRANQGCKDGIRDRQELDPYRGASAGLPAWQLVKATQQIT